MWHMLEKFHNRSSPNQFSSLFLKNYWHMLRIKSKFSTAFQLLTDCQIEVFHETVLSSFISHMNVESHHDLQKEVIHEIAQNNTNYKIQFVIRKLFKIFNIGDVILHICSTVCFKS